MSPATFNWATERIRLDSPAVDGETVTPSDVNELTKVSRAIYVGGTGNLTVVMWHGTTLTFSAVPIGTVLPICVKQVNATGTTATLIVALY